MAQYRSAVSLSTLFTLRTMVVLLVGLSLLWILSPGGAAEKTRQHLDVACDRSVDVAIVGAGVAGTYFAYKLREAGLNIELLEYSDRIGGRLFTTSLPNIPDVNLELGGMRFIDGEHTRVQRLVKLLNLTPVEFLGGTAKSENEAYFLREHAISRQDLLTGPVPYNLSREEKEHQADLVEYYKQKLVGDIDAITDENALKLKTKDGRELYKLTTNEALATVCTPEGRQFVKDSKAFGGLHADNSIYEYLLNAMHKATAILTIKEGMSSLPESMVRAFLQSSYRHKVAFNRKLEAIKCRINGRYQLQLMRTTTDHCITTVTGPPESVCAKKVILAIPHFALTQLKWNTLRFPKVKSALEAVTPVKVNKVFMTFPRAWWLNGKANMAYLVRSDLTFIEMYNWTSSKVTGDVVMMASYAYADITVHQQSLNSQGGLLPGSVIGQHRVSRRLKQELIRELSQAFGVNESLIPEPISAISQFWTSYPFGGAWTEWKAGYNFSDVMQTIRRPSLLDDVYIVGSDHAFVASTPWTEGALTVVDEVYEKYFT